jgi:hypothetical protein
MRNYAIALVLASTVALPHVIYAHRPTPPPVPTAIEVPAGNKPFLMARAIGTQGYVCVAVGTTFSWATFGPQATLFNENYQQVLTHFLSPNPFDNNNPAPTWQHSRDTSAVWAKVIATSDDPAYVAPGAIPWLLLQTVTQPGPTGGDKMTPTTFIHRVNTVGGKAPTTGCAVAEDIKKRALVPYEADYVFYKSKAHHLVDDED